MNKTTFHLLLMFSIFIPGSASSGPNVPARAEETADKPVDGSRAQSKPGMLNNEVNGGWYGWLGNHKIAGMYDPAMDAAGMRRHHINWYWLGKQWVLPFLVADMADVRQTMIAESKRARIWVELYWWGDHSTWDGFHGLAYPELQQRLKEKGIPPGGDNLTGKDWFAIAEDSQVMQSVKKTIKWQLDTMAQYLGTNTIYGVLLSEEEPDHGMNVTVGQAGAKRYQDRDATQKVLIRVHNELYGYVKSLYPNLKVAPGFYPAWVKPGALRYDAIVMDNYPGFGQEEEKINEWLRAYGKDVEQYALLWGHGNLDYKLELARLEKFVKLHLDQGIKNIGFFDPRLALKDPIYRMFDTRGVGSYAPYDLEEHRSAVVDLLDETTRIVGELRQVKGVKVAPPPSENPAAPSARKALCAMADRIYAYRKGLLDAAFDKVAFSKQWVDFSQMIQLAHAEGWIPASAVKEYPQISKSIKEWENLSKELGTLPKFYEAVLPVEQEIREHARKVASALPDAARKESAIKTRLQKAGKDLEADAYPSAFDRLKEARELLVESQKEKSWQISLQLGNRYGYTLTVEVILTADYGDGRQNEIYRGVPFESSKRAALPLNFILPSRPRIVTLATGPWSGDLSIHALRTFNSRETLKPALVKEEHAKGIQDYLENPDGGFDLCPWASAAHVTLKYPTK
ncbi:MAG: hypothetical protein HY360_16965 [Verrucomicrobia bacterium]|nr:hypothetical protein [Verrucomicrobiota bacterium]